MAHRRIHNIIFDPNDAKEIEDVVGEFFSLINDLYPSESNNNIVDLESSEYRFIEDLKALPSGEK